jgi:AIPR protein
MTASDIVVLLDDILKQNRQEIANGYTDAEFFELFCSQQILRDYDVGSDDIETGMVGNNDGSRKEGSDGGIDALYILVNGSPVNDADAARNLKSLKHKVQIDVVIIQASTQPGFTLDRILRLKDTSENIFSLDRAPEQFTETYNEALLDAIERFRLAHSSLITKRPALHLSYFYVTKGDAANVAQTIKVKADEFAASASSRLLGTISKCTFTFVGARELIDLSRKERTVVYPLKCVHCLQPSKVACVALVKLTEYAKFITHPTTGEILTSLFESNVRDYQGADVRVNQEIYSTLSLRAPEEEFWWLNNGITIVVDELGGYTQELILTAPQVVNGLQTSQEIYNYFQGHPNARTEETREVLVRIIASENPALQDKLIRATNNQISIPIEFLWGSDPIHRDIETLFRARGLYYDRRKNSWKRAGMPLAKVVGITELAQSVAAIRLQEPDNARARPSRYFRDKGEYKRIFDPKHDIELYLVCAQVRKRVEAFLRQSDTKKKERNNLIYYVMMVASCLVTRAKRPRSSTIAALDVERHFADQLLTEAIDIVGRIYADDPTDKAAKGTQMLINIKTELSAMFGRKTKAQRA